jgi:hypothetical protein
MDKGDQILQAIEQWGNRISGEITEMKEDIGTLKSDVGTLRAICEWYRRDTPS